MLSFNILIIDHVPMYFLYRVFDIFDKRIMRDNKVNLLKNGVKYILSFFKSAIYFDINQK
ncbi:hypothetical protein [Flavobacterium xueshanense]|nr:hypothetical protein [Flavobacterium xueshanense]